MATTLKVKVTFEEEVLGTAANNPDIHREFIGTKSPNALTVEEEVEAIGVEEVFDKSMTVFPRTEDGVPFAWDYQWRGFLKESIGFLRKIPGTACSGIKAYKKEVDGLIFVNPRKIPYENYGEIGICQRPLRAQTPKGECVALASSEMVPAGTTQTFEIECMLDSDAKAVKECLEYGRKHGFSQWRNSGKGRFTFEILEEKSDKKAK